MIVLRDVGASDCGRLAILHAECFPDDAWNADAIRQVLSMSGAFAILAIDGTTGEPRGFLIGQAIVGQCEILGLGVRRRARRGGVGRTLLDRVLGEALAAQQTIFLEVAEDNTAARALYASAGLVIVGRRPGYYRRPDGTFVAALQLRHGPAKV